MHSSVSKPTTHAVGDSPTATVHQAPIRPPIRQSQEGATALHLVLEGGDSAVAAAGVTALLREGAHVGARDDVSRNAAWPRLTEEQARGCVGRGATHTCVDTVVCCCCLCSYLACDCVTVSPSRTRPTTPPTLQRPCTTHRFHDYRQFGWTPLCEAAFNGHAAAIRAVVAAGADVEFAIDTVSGG